MQEYLEQGLLVPHEGMFYVERRFGSKCRRGILLCLDLEQYDFQKGSQSLIRATEGTIIERLPPRIKIREKRHPGGPAHHRADRRPASAR